MPEGPPRPEKRPSLEEYIRLAEELSQNAEAFPFSGLTGEAYAALKKAAAEYPEYSTPIDELVARFEQHGMKVVLGKNPESGNVFILPGDSDDIEMDSIFPRHLDIAPGMDQKLKQLIVANRK
jgi:hypothetical protein